MFQQVDESSSSGQYMSLASCLRPIFSTVLHIILMAKFTKIQDSEDAVVEYVCNTVSTYILLIG